MRFSVSTVKDTPEHVESFVARNLGGGIDHLVVFLDDPADPATPAVRALLDDHPHVSCVVADDAWWGGKRPPKLNVRQRIHANLVKALLTRVEAAEWVFHIDADEVVRLDPEAMAGVPDRARTVQLAPLEAVSQVSWPQDPTVFKRLLDGDELNLLYVLGVLDRAHNGAYFHGHVDGKTGARPGTDVWLTLHRPVDEAGTEVASHRDDGLVVLHYESHSGEEFVRKWTALIDAGPLASFRAGREPTARALQTLVSRGLPAAVVEPLLMQVFRRTTEDDLATLDALGLLVHVDPDQPLRTPQLIDDDDRATLDRLLARSSGRGKRAFHPGEPESALHKALGQIAGGGRFSR